MESGKQENNGTPERTAAKDQSQQIGDTKTPSISLPKGGGAIKGIGEKFQANPVTGTGSFNVPIAMSQGRAEFTPQLVLSYDSGAGNSPYGLGWDIGLPSITRKTQKGLPLYQDADESDVFILSGTEDLVPIINDLLPKEQTIDGIKYSIKRYRPRTEGMFARIEKWTGESGISFWKTITKENVTTIYGNQENARIAHPEEETKIFQWLLAYSYDDKGNIIQYEYKPGDGQGIAKNEKHYEEHRNHYAQKYLKRVWYGNTIPCDRDGVLDDNNKWLFELIFDYGEGHLTKDNGKITVNYNADEQNTWKCRQDVFSNFRAGFDIRTYRLCERILMFHHFEELGTAPYLVRSTDLNFNENPIATTINSIAHTAYKFINGKWTSQPMPPLSFKYTEAKIDEQIKDVHSTETPNLPQGIDGNHYRWSDLYSNGLGGVLADYNDAWYFKHNLGKGELGAMQLVAEKPNIALSGGGQLTDIDGDGQAELLVQTPALKGYFEFKTNIYPDKVDDNTGKMWRVEEWENFIPFEACPNINWQDPNLRMLDLTGDGHADILITENDCLLWYPSKAKAGYDIAQKVAKHLDEEKGPAIVFNDGTQAIFLADMCGDGLTDIVRIQNGNVCYWANIGYGRFSSKVTMQNAPIFDYADQFDPKRIRLTDIDGTGTTDILYLGHYQITYWHNQSGNSWSEQNTIDHFPQTNNLNTISVLDFLGNGTACIVWSSPLPANANTPMKYIQLMEQKPYLLCEVNNNMGAITRMGYTPSTKFYRDDEKNGTPWITKLPFPVQCLSRVETFDEISKSHFVNRYAYRHGYFDGEEREFRGFGMVEQWDTEDYESLDQNSLFKQEKHNWNETTDMPPVYTKTWFHNGFYIDNEKIAKQFEHEYCKNEDLGSEWLLTDTVLPDELNVEEARQAARSLKGKMLRQEIYALDKSDKEDKPYSVTETKYHIKTIQKQEENRHAVFYVCNCETLTFHTERQDEDPRIAHQHTLEIDDYGNVLKMANIVFPRKEENINELADFDSDVKKKLKKEQGKLLITYTETNYINVADSQAFYRIGIPYEVKQYEVAGFKIDYDNRPFEKEALKTAIENATEIPFEEETNGTKQKRLIAHTQNTFYNENANAELPLGELAFHALPYQNYQMAFTPKMLEQSFDSRVNETMLKDEGKYINDIDTEGNWWLPSPIQEFDAAHFYLPIAYADPFGHRVAMEYDAHYLMMTAIHDTYGESNATYTTTAENNYRVLQPSKLTNPNGAVSEALFDTLGMVYVTSTYKGGKGDKPLSAYAPITPSSLKDVMEEPLKYLQGATTFFHYNLFAWKNDQQPVFAANIVRTTHVSDLNGTETPVQKSILYSDGFGREALTKVQAEAGEAFVKLDGGSVKKDGNGEPIKEHTDKRWLGSGRTIYNNKGKPVKQYEPYFINTYQYEDDAAVREIGVSPLMHYDPLGRLIRTDFPDGTFSKVAFNAWMQKNYDQNDTVLESEWYKNLGDFPRDFTYNFTNRSDAPKVSAAKLAAKHANTPEIVHLDTLGRPFLNTQHNRKEDGSNIFLHTQTLQDIQGNQTEIRDAKLVGGENRVIYTATYNMLQQPIHTHSVDAGDRWLLPNIAQQPIHQWDEKEQHIYTRYDSWQRPTRIYLHTKETDDNGSVVALTKLAERLYYGENIGDATAAKDRNLLGQLHLHFDGAGLAKNEAMDFKGNPLKASRQLTAKYDEVPDWMVLENEIQAATAESSVSGTLKAGQVFTTSTQYDALNRPTKQIAPDGSETDYTYNEAGLLESVTATANGTIAQNHPDFVKNIDYDAKGQRERIVYGNDTVTYYKYDERTFRLTNLKTTRKTDPKILQNLFYAYDPVGNITEIKDKTKEGTTHTYAGELITDTTRYEYDCLYQLIKVYGREHRSTNQTPEHKGAKPHIKDPVNPNDVQAFRNYRRHYEYDEVGNILKMQHIADRNSWTRKYTYDIDSNRLIAYTKGGKTYAFAYDANGNMTEMEHIESMEWDYRNQLITTKLNGGGNTTYYQYDAQGQRVRKWHIDQNGNVKERIYLGSYELFGKYSNIINYNSRTPESSRHSLHIMDNQARIAIIDTPEINPNNDAPTIRYQYADHLGSSSLELDETANIITYEEYYPYGNTSYKAAINQSEVKRKRYRYTGKERDEETGLYYYGARYYICWLGRWCSPDPAGFVDGGNLYRYVRGNPVGLVDDQGLNGSDVFPPPQKWLSIVKKNLKYVQANYWRNGKVKRRMKLQLHIFIYL